MAQFDKLNEELSTFVDGVNSELLALEGRLKSFTVDTRGINASFDLLTAELLRVAILFEGVAQKIQGYANVEQKATETFANDLQTAGNATKDTLDQIDQDIIKFGSTVTTADNNIGTFGRNVDDSAKKAQNFGDNFQTMGDVVGSSAANLSTQFTTTTDAFKTEAGKFADSFGNVFDSVKNASAELASSFSKLMSSFAAESVKAEDTLSLLKQYGKAGAESFYGQEPTGPKTVEPWSTGVIDEIHTAMDDLVDEFKNEAAKIENVNISDILKDYADKVKEATGALPSGPAEPPKPPEPPPIPPSGGSPEDDGKRPKLSRGAGLFERLAASSDVVAKALANFGQSIFSTQSTIMGAGRVFDGIQKSALQLTADLTKAAFAAAFFVNAFNPALVQQFTYNLKDLQAVIGTGLVPILNAFALEVRLLADTLLPVLQALQPAFQELGNAIIGFLTPIVKQIGSSLLTLSNTLNNLLGPAISKFALSLGSLIAELMRSLTPIINTVIKFFSAFLSILSVVVNILKEFAPILAGVMTGFITLIGVQAIAALSAFIASVWAASNMMTFGLASLVGAIVGFISWLTTKESEASQGLTGISEGLQARKAEYSTPEELSRNLIKAAFGGANTDRLKNIDANGKRQVELLEIIANKKNPAAGVANARNEAGLKPGFLRDAAGVLQNGPFPAALGL